MESDKAMDKLAAVCRIRGIAEQTLDALVDDPTDEKKLTAALTEISNLCARTNEELNALLYRRKRINYSGGSVNQITKLGRKLVGVVRKTEESISDEDYPIHYYAEVFEGDELLFAIDNCKRGKSFLEGVVRGALRGAILRMTHSMRFRANRKARIQRKGGAE